MSRLIGGDYSGVLRLLVARLERRKDRDSPSTNCCQRMPIGGPEGPPLRTSVWRLAAACACRLAAPGAGRSGGRDVVRGGLSLGVDILFPRGDQRKQLAGDVGTRVRQIVAL